MAKHAIATVGEIPVGERKIVTINGRSIGVFNVNGEYYALRNICPHQSGPLCEGIVSGFLKATIPGEFEYTRRGEIVRCPWHGWEFDIKTGQSWFDPVKTRVRTYPVSVEAVSNEPEVIDPETGLVAGPYMAESYAVSIEQQMVYVDVP